MRIHVIAALALLGGCVPTSFYTRPLPLDVQADQFNVAAARAERLMIVRNVMRGRDRMSMIFTRIESFTGSSQRSLEATAGLTAIEGPHNDQIEPGVTVSGEVSPSFNLSILDDQKFQRAMSAPIDLGLYESLLDSGWKPNLLHTLFIEKVEIKTGATTVRYENDPSNPERFQAFQTWLMSHDETSLQVCSSSHNQTFSPPLQTPVAAADVAAIAEQHLAFGRVHPEDPDPAADRPQHGVTAPEATRNDGALEWRVVKPDSDQWLDFNCDTPTPGLTVYVRSIESILFYLGEVVRAEQSDNAHNLNAQIYTHGHYVPQAFFVVRSSGHPAAADLVFQHEDGHTYYVPHPDPTATDADVDRTHQVITLMLQLIGLLQEREDLPPTASVRVVP